MGEGRGEGDLPLISFLQGKGKAYFLRLHHNFNQKFKKPLQLDQLDFDFGETADVSADTGV